MSSSGAPVTKIAVLSIGSILLLGIAFAYTWQRSDQPMQSAAVSPTQMSERANELLRSLGYRDRPAERWSEFRSESAGHDKHVFRFIERQSLDHFDTVIDGFSILPISGLAPGERRVVFDTQGRLVQLTVQFPRTYDGSEPAGKFDWNLAFAAAGLELAAFSPIDPAWTPAAAADAYNAWNGRSPDDPNVMLRVEASTFRGQLTNFLVVFPWAEPEQPRPAAATSKDRLLITFAIVGIALFIFLILRLVWTRTADPSTSARPAYALAAATFVPMFLGHLTTTPQTAAFGPLIERAALASMIALAAAMLAWMTYSISDRLASEGHSRLFSSWITATGRNWISRRVGLDLLYGIFAGGCIVLVIAGLGSLDGHEEHLANVSELALSPFGSLLIGIGQAVIVAVLMFGTLSIALSIVRWRSIAGAVIVALLTLFGWLMQGDAEHFDASFIGLAVIAGFVAARFGLLATIISCVVAKLCINLSLASVLSSETTLLTAVTYGLVLALLAAGIGLSIATADEPSTDSEKRPSV